MGWCCCEAGDERARESFCRHLGESSLGLYASYGMLQGLTDRMMRHYDFHCMFLFLIVVKLIMSLLVG